MTTLIPKSDAENTPGGESNPVSEINLQNSTEIQPLKLPEMDPIVEAVDETLSRQATEREELTKLPSLLSKHPTYVTDIPERDTMLWEVRDFTSFRDAAKVSHIPPLVSPEFGGGCKLRLWPYVKEHVKGCVDMPATKWSRDGVANFEISVLKSGKDLITRRVEICSERGKCASAQVTHFCLTQEKMLQPIRLNHLLLNNTLTLRVQMSYFPLDSKVFRSAPSPVGGDELTKGLLWDIQSFCREDPSQNVEIRSVGKSHFACRFLVAARSKKFREILKKAGNATAVTVKDVSPDVLEQFLEYINTDQCEWLLEKVDQPTPLEALLALFQAADTYQVDGLVKRVAELLENRMTKETVIEIWDVVDQCTYQPIKDACTNYMDSIPGSQVVSMLRSAVSSAVSTPRNN